MAELMIRAGANDAALMERVWAGRSTPDRRHLAERLVLDAHVAAAEPALAMSARRAGVPVLIDPQTHFLQSEQHPGDRWAALGFSSRSAMDPETMLRPARQEQIVSATVDFQLRHGATAIIPPYVAIDAADDGWLTVQCALWESARRYLRRHQLTVPVVAVVALGWRWLPREAWPQTLPLFEDLTALDPDEVALAASKVDAGVRPDLRLAGLASSIERFTRLAPVIAWSQGTLGDAAVAAGAIGYETGVGWRERCDLRAAMASRRRPPSGPPGARPVYVPALKRSIPKKHLAGLLDEPRLAPHLLCMDASCCASGRKSLLGDARLHAIRRRAHSLHVLAEAERRSWRWGALSAEADNGLRLAEMINTAAQRTPGLARVDMAALQAMKTIADNRRHTLRRAA